MPSYRSPRDRDARATIRGYVYQAELTIARWLELEPGQILELEHGEDIDLVAQAITTEDEYEQYRLLEQVKHREQTVTLKTSALSLPSSISTNTVWPTRICPCSSATQQMRLLAVNGVLRYQEGWLLLMPGNKSAGEL